jgi:hypothetical protein
MKASSLMLVPVAALALLSACTSPQGHGSMMGGSGSGTGMGGSGGMGMAGGDSAQMCAMHRQMMAGKSPAEQNAAMEAQMRSMHGGNVTPEQVRMHREMMEKNCGGTAGTR